MRLSLARAVLVLALIGPLLAGTALAGPAEEALGFARHLKASGESELAAGEFRRYLYLQPDGPEAGLARIELAETYLTLSRPDKAGAALRALGPGLDPDLRARAGLAWAEVELRSGRLGEAEARLNELAADLALPRAGRDRALYRLGWHHLEAGRFDQAAGAFGLVSPGGSLGPAAAFLAKEAPRGLDLPRRSPVRAGLLSILPGLGQLILGRYADAGWAFGLTAGCGLGAWLALSGGSWVSGLVLGGLAVAFYGGNIYNAVNHAERLNRQTLVEFRQRLRDQARGLGGE